MSDVIGTRISAAAAAGISPAALQRYIREENTPPFDVAVRLCQAANARLEWLATGEGQMSQGAVADTVSQALRRDDLKMAIQLAAEALGDKALPPPKHAELVTLIYELLEEGLPEAKILRFARAATS